jgi:DNA-binding transcriptional MerR regulator
LTLKLGYRFTLGAVDGLRVSELAERAGVAPSTVRFYERAGLLSPARRIASGYRVFDESALDELAFISRAKGIGMSLEDIVDLVASWPVGECWSLQARLRAYLAGRIGRVRQQAAEMGRFERQLQAVLDRQVQGQDAALAVLSGPSAEEPVAPRCGHDDALTGLAPAVTCARLSGRIVASRASVSTRGSRGFCYCEEGRG